ncbi:aminodeoxychorismate synthase component I [Shewanella surugensis]|uniref:aminodeoxychorismate synthase n=1 Tax=Shewanella surugensis TaxID=212020 RepID=A0ABT0LJW9_9GAMM|nr:aminodeoxychorismate synthase component I [Shewanella surugensis]MCL1127587.1 aminodeoxychorismate synthase component I [Shewanella surugensis]
MSETANNTLFFRRIDCKLSTETLFDYFSDSPWAILLDSANAIHCDAHVDIICAAPIATLTTKNQTSTLAYFEPSSLNRLNNSHLTPIKVHQSQDDPFQLLETTLARLFPINKTAPFPFCGGAMGSFSYDLGRHIEILPKHAKHDIQLPEMNVGFYTWAFIFNYQEQCWYLLHYEGESAANSLLDELQTLLSLPLIKARSHFDLCSPWQNQITQQEYEQKFDRIQSYLQSGDCYQINLTQRFSACYQGDEYQAYKTLRDSNCAPFSAFIRLPEQALLSISPERFIQLREYYIQTKPIKGTMPRYDDPVMDANSADCLRHSTKDRAENVMIVDLLRNDLGKVAKAGSVSVPNLFDIESFPAVHHLVSTVTAELDEHNSAASLLRAAFPGGSITGAPKIRAMEIIEELEPSRRSLYCGSIGYLSQDGQMDTSITIRTLVAENQQLYCWAGGGIVADSVAAAEYQESYDKVSQILPILSNE